MKKIVFLFFIFFNLFVFVETSFSEKLDDLIEEDSQSLEAIIEQAKLYRKQGKVKFNFENIDLNLLTYFMAELMDKNIILQTDLRGTASIVLSEPVSLEEAWEIYTSILRTRGYNVIDKGGYVEIVPASKSRSIIPPVSHYPEDTEEMITYVYRLKNANILHAYTVLKGLKSPQGKVLAYRPANIIIITDTAANIKNLKRVLAFLDTDDFKGIVKIYRLRYANSSEIAAAISSIFGDYTRRGVFIKTFNLKSQNTVIVRIPQELEDQLDEIIYQLDRPLDNIAYRKFHIIYLKNAKAKNIADILNKLLRNIQLVSFDDTGTRRSQRAISMPYSKEQPRVIADESSNALVIYANEIEFKAIKDLVSKLDIQKKQILITALIAEISESTLKQIGVKWQILGTQGAASFRAGLSSSDFYSNLSQGNLSVGVLSTSGVRVDVNGTTLFFPDLLFLFSLLESGSGFNVISSPKVLVMDNMKAKINVSKVIPYAESVKYDVNGNPIVNYNYREVGLILEVSPHISGNNIIMEIHQEVNDIIGYKSAQVGNLSYIVPETSKREIDTMITIENGRTVVLGGLVSTKTIKSIEGVPILSKLPIIGNLFKYESDTNEKTNLFVFITPYIINSPEELAKITEEHMKLVKKLKERGVSIKDDKLITNPRNTPIKKQDIKEFMNEYNRNYFGR